MDDSCAEIKKNIFLSKKRSLLFCIRVGRLQCKENFDK